jgi:glycosyltransferase involved in cell wall biosynthesis
MSSEKLSIVIPACDEQQNIRLLASEIEAVFRPLKWKWECIWVDDGSQDNTWTEIRQLGRNHRGIRLSRNYGQSTAIMAGIDESKYEIIVTLDGDLQNDPSDIPFLLEHLEGNIDLVNGFRKHRQDKFFSRKLPSWIANKIAQVVTKTKFKDLGCTLRVFRKHVISDLRIMGEMHRLLNIHFYLLGVNHVEVPTRHRARQFGKSKYGISRTFKFVADLVLAKFLRILTSRPLYLFGYISVCFLTIGIIAVMTALLLPTLGLTDHVDGSIFLGGLIITSIGFLFIGLGLLGESLLRVGFASIPSSQYKVREKV